MRRNSLGGLLPDTTAAPKFSVFSYRGAPGTDLQIVLLTTQRCSALPMALGGV